LDVVLVGRVDDIGLDHQVLVDEVGWVGVVGVDAPYFGCCQVDLVWFFTGYELVDLLLIG